MKVLVACEFSGIVRDSFLRRGHDAISCDLLPTERKGPHIQGDLREVDLTPFDLLIAHPPCTHLATSGARWFKEKQHEQQAALDFVNYILNAPVYRIALENPVSIISSKVRKPDQIIQPYQFGHPERKTTCLWLKNLPPLKPTDLVEPEGFKTYPSGKRVSKWYSRTGGGSGKKRSVTFPGIAAAMADQWGCLNDQNEV